MSHKRHYHPFEPALKGPQIPTCNIYTTHAKHI